MGVDLGEARVGVALSDPEKTLAFPLKDVKVYGDSFQALDECIDIVTDRHVGHVVIGLPLSLSGEEGKSAKKARRWARQLAVRMGREGLEVPEISLQDERLTTVTAHRQLRQSGHAERSHRPMVDQQAAVIILQSALDTARSARNKTEPQAQTQPQEHTQAQARPQLPDQQSDPVWQSDPQSDLRITDTDLGKRDE